MSASAPIPANPARILLIKPSSLGDVITALPILRGLRRRFPQAHIAWLLANSCAGVLDQDPDLSEVILFDRKHLGQAWRSRQARRDLHALMSRLRGGKFDWVIDAQGLLRSGWFARVTRAPLRLGFADAREAAWMFYNHRVQPTAAHTVDRNIQLVRAVGVEACSDDMRLHVSPRGMEFTQAFLREHGLRGKDFIVVVPPTRWPTKVYPVRHWRVVVAELSRTMPVALLGSPGDHDLVHAVRDQLSGKAVFDLCGQTGLSQMAALIAASAGVICSDSAAKFIAPAVGVDCISLLGPTRAERTGPYLRGRALVANVACRGCLKRRCSHITCMQSIRPEEVIAEVRKMLGA